MQYDLLRLPQVLARVGYSRSTLYSKIKTGEFPAPISLGTRAVAWISGEIDEWIDRQIKESRKTRSPSIAAANEPQIRGAIMGTLYDRSSAGWSSYTRRKLPPYAKQLADKLATGWQPAWTGSVFIATGDHAWNLGRQWAENASVSDRAFLVLPPGTDPSIYDWRIVAGHDCVLYDTGSLSDATGKDFAVLLIQTGADLVLVVSEERDTVSYRSRMPLGEVA